MAGGAAIDGGTTSAGGVPRHGRCDTNAAHLSDKSPGDVVLVGADGLLVGTVQSTTRAWRLSMGTWPDSSDGPGGVGLAGQQCSWLAAGAVGLVAEGDAAEIPFGTLLARLWSTKTRARA